MGLLDLMYTFVVDNPEALVHKPFKQFLFSDSTTHWRGLAQTPWCGVSNLTKGICSVRSPKAANPNAPISASQSVATASVLVHE